VALSHRRERVFEPGEREDDSRQADGADLERQFVDVSAESPSERMLKVERGAGARPSLSCRASSARRSFCGSYTRCRIRKLPTSSAARSAP
jgi:hypothetical protein